MINFKNLIYVFLFALLALVLLFALRYLNVNSTITQTEPNLEKELQNDSAVNQIEEKELPKTEKPLLPGQQKYTSTNLGVSLLYINELGNDLSSNVEEVGNKIYIFAPGSSSESGQYMEVFTKAENDTLLQAVQKQFLVGYSASDCEAYELTKTWNNKAISENMELVNIRVAGGWESMEDLMVRWEKCPKPYTESNGISYFMADKNHPDKFAFFSIGQYAISAGTDESGSLTWQDTVEFLD